MEKLKTSLICSAKEIYWFISNTWIKRSLFSIKESFLKEGKNKKIISFSLYGSDLRYFGNLYTCINTYQVLFEDWQIRIYLAADIDKSILSELKKLGCEVIVMKGEGIDYRYMYWRFLPLDDEDVSQVIIRDIDSLASLREKNMVDIWLLSNKNLHIIRDHDLHDFKIMGGIWGMKKHNKCYNIKKKMLAYAMKNRYGSDLYFLETIYDNHLNDMHINDVIQRYENEEPIILARDENFYIGQINVVNSGL